MKPDKCNECMAQMADALLKQQMEIEDLKRERNTMNRKLQTIIDKLMARAKG